MLPYVYHASFLVVLVKVFGNGQCLENYKKYINVKSSNFTKCVQVNNYTFTCPSLEKALERDLNFTSIKIFTLLENLSKQNVLINVHNLTIANANPSSQICITCKTNHSSKISFIDSSNIYINGLIFDSCGGTGQNDFLTINRTKINLSSVLYLRDVTGLVINNTTFQGSRGYSIIMADVVNILYYKVQFSSNKVVPFLDEENLLYGGGMLTFLSDSTSGEVNTLTISNCDFNFINATDSAKAQYSFTQGQNDTVSDLFKNTFLGKGGGLSFYLQNQHISTKISIKSCKFYHNRAFSGGGIYLEIGQYVHTIYIKINDTLFVDNFANFSGGAINILRNAKNNSVVYLSYSFFTGNRAEFGGGLALISSLKYLESKFHSNQEMKIIYCEFGKNVGTLGSAMYLNRTSVLLHMLNITENDRTSFLPKKVSHSSKPSLTTLQGVGALYFYKSHVIINGTSEAPTRICKNFNSAFVLDFSYLYVLGIVFFEENQGSKGGAISIYEESAIFLFDTTNLTFSKNSAVKGGAIYVYLTSPPVYKWNSHELFIYKCFFRYHHTSIGSFKGSVIFNNNMAARNDGSAIFVNTLQGCQDSSSHNFSGISFQGNNDSYITTDPVNITVNETQWENVSPGMQFSANINLTDEMGNNVDAAIEITFEPEEKVSIKDNKNRMIVTNNTVELVILGDQNANFSVTIRTPQGRAFPRKIVNKSLKDCPFAYSYSSATKSCDCLNVKNQNRMISRCIGNDIYLYKQVWAYFNQIAIHADKATTQVCPIGYCNQSCGSSKDSVDCKYDPRYQCAENRDQSPSNYLCAKCAQSYSVAFASEKCIDCRGKHQWWVTLLIFLAIPVLVIVILLLNIDVYKLFLNSLIFFYQAASLFVIPVWETDVAIHYMRPMQVIMVRSMQVIMGVIDLRGLGNEADGYCFYDGLNDIDKNMLNYCIPFLMILTLVLIIIISGNVPFILPFEQVNTFRAILFVMVLAYSDITRITLDILNVVEINGENRVRIYAVMEYFGRDHIYYAVPAIFILVVFVIGIPVFLITPSVLMAYDFEICDCLIHNGFYTRYIRPFLESFLSVFNNNLKCHLFSAFYFIFRLILLLMITFMQRSQFQLTMMAFLCLVMLLLFVKVQPYQGGHYNYFDMFILLNLTVVAFLCNGKLQLPIPYYSYVLECFFLVLLWLPLVVWIFVLIVKYRKKIYEKLFTIFARCYGRYMELRRI